MLVFRHLHILISGVAGIIGARAELSAANGDSTALGGSPGANIVSAVFSAVDRISQSSEEQEQTSQQPSVTTTTVDVKVTFGEISSSSSTSYTERSTVRSTVLITTTPPPPPRSTVTSTTFVDPPEPTGQIYKQTVLPNNLAVAGSIISLDGMDDDQLTVFAPWVIPFVNAKKSEVLGGKGYVSDVHVIATDLIAKPLIQLRDGPLLRRSEASTRQCDAYRS